MALVTQYSMHSFCTNKLDFLKKYTYFASKSFCYMAYMMSYMTLEGTTFPTDTLSPFWWTYHHLILCLLCVGAAIHWWLLHDNVQDSKAYLKVCGYLFVNERVSLENINSLKIVVYFTASISLAAECRLVVTKQVNIMSEHVHWWFPMINNKQVVT